METLLIVLVIVGTMIVLGTRLSFYLYKSGALENTHVKHSRRLHPVAVGIASKGTSTIDLAQINESKSWRARIVLFLAVLVLVIAIFAIVMISMISAAFS